MTPNDKLKASSAGQEGIGDYGYSQSGETGLTPEVWNSVLDMTKAKPNGRALDLGCGNGYRASLLNKLGYDVVGVEPSVSGIKVARATYPGVIFVCGSTNDNLVQELGTFDLIISLEVVEHVYSVEKYMATVKSLLKPDGIFILSTPYHGWLKNVAIALLGKFDSHVNPLWEGGHIKFFSVETLTKAMIDGGFKITEVRRVGRIAPLAKSMVFRATHATT